MYMPFTFTIYNTSLREGGLECKPCLPNPEDSAPESFVRSKSRSVRLKFTARPFMFSMRSCITGISSKICSGGARFLSMMSPAVREFEGIRETTTFRLPKSLLKPVEAGSQAKGS